MPPVATVVNNAGSVLRKETVSITDAEWRTVLAVNVDGTFFVTRAFLPDLLRLVLSSRSASTVAPALSSMLIYLVMAIVLVVRPAGLFPTASK